MLIGEDSMTYKKLQNKTAKQLKTFIYNYRWNKNDIVDFLFDYYTYLDDYFPENNVLTREDLNNFTLEQLCERYHADVVDFVWEELCGA